MGSKQLKIAQHKNLCMPTKNLHNLLIQEPTFFSCWMGTTKAKSNKEREREEREREGKKERVREQKEDISR